MVIYADTSFLVSLYGRDASSVKAQQFAQTLNQQFAYTPLHRLEARNALRLAVFRKDISAKECKAVLSAITTDEKVGVLHHCPVAWAELFDQAEALSVLHTPKLGARAMDILHVAASIILGLREFLTFDKRQAALAKKVGIFVHPV